MNLKQIQQDFANNIIVSRETLVRAIDYAVELERRNQNQYEALHRMGNEMEMVCDTLGLPYDEMIDVIIGKIESLKDK